jgi:hypothetical protein
MIVPPILGSAAILDPAQRPTDWLPARNWVRNIKQFMMIPFRLLCGNKRSFRSVWEASLSQVPIHKLFFVVFFLFSPPHFLFCLPNCLAFKRARRPKPRSLSTVNATASDCLNFILSFLDLIRMVRDNVLRSKRNLLVFSTISAGPEDQEDAEFLKNWKEGLAATNADEIKQLRGGQTLSATPRHRQRKWDNYKNRGLREGETDNSLRLGRVIRSQDAINIVSQIRSDQNIGNREDSNQNQCNSRTSHHGRY